MDEKTIRTFRAEHATVSHYARQAALDRLRDRIADDEAELIRSFRSELAEPRALARRDARDRLRSHIAGRSASTRSRSPARVRRSRRSYRLFVRRVQTRIEYQILVTAALGAGLASALGFVVPAAALSLLAAVVVLVAALRQEYGRRVKIATAAAIAERRRVARDLHEGLAQDLAFIAAHYSQTSTKLGPEHPVAVAARRALEMSRGTIGELSDPAGATTLGDLEAVARELRDRFDISIAVFGELDHELAPHAREQIVRIAREAIANAARHGCAKHVVVALRQTADGIALRVTDDGSGFPPDADEGFGISSMRERASALGGRLTIGPARKRGTEFEVSLPIAIERNVRSARRRA